jgi:ketosteroid isomerase-like protein
MSLVGSLEDLALGDILQIVSLSRKSGLLLLRSNSGEGRIVLSDGLVCAAYVKGESEDLRGLLVGGSFLPCDDFDRCEMLATETGRSLDEVLGERTSQSGERIDSLRREHIERAVLAMFRWRTGEFAFEVREEIAERDRELMIPVGINAQYLTMEATRLGDESAVGEDGLLGASDPGGTEEDSDDDDFVFSGEDAGQEETLPIPANAEEAPAPALPADPLTPFDGVIDPGDEACAVLLDASTDEADALAGFDVEAAEALALACAQQVADSEGPEPFAEPTPPPVTALPQVSLIVIDPELSALEWLKASLAEHFVRIHIFQHVDGGIDRIRQYLARSERPLVLLSTHLAEVLRDGDAGLHALISRLKALSPEMQVVLLHREGSPSAGLSGSDGRLACPSTYELSDRRRWSRLADAVERLGSEIAPWVSRCQATALTRSAIGVRAAPTSGPDPALARLRQVSERLRDPSSRGDVLSLVLEFAAESFNRVAIFMLRDDQAVGIAQIGLERAGGPDARALREFDIAADKSAWFREVIACRRAVRSAPTDASNRRLTELLGAQVPAEAYVAPIESGGRVAALLYADNLPDETPIADTTALEIVLHEAGLALDRAFLERALSDPAEHTEREERL